MNKEALKELKEKLSKLTEEEKKQRDLYLRKLANGEIEGPSVGYASIDKQWLKYYEPEGIETDIPRQKAYDFIYEANLNNMNDIAFEYMGNNITYSKLFKRIEETAKAFMSLNVTRGDIVTMAMPMSPEAVYIIYGLNRIGAITNCISPLLSENEIKDKLISTNSKIFIALDMLDEKIKSLEKNKTIDYCISVSPVESASLIIKKLYNLKNKNSNNNLNNNIIKWKDFLDKGKSIENVEDSSYIENEPIVILYTGGTTGKPKGVMLTNDNFNTMALTQSISGFDVARGDTFLTFLPPFTAYCLVNAIHDPLYLGWKNTLVPKFSAEDFPKLIKKYKPNHVLSGPILWDLLIKDKTCQSMDFSFFKSPISGGDSMKNELENKINKFLLSHGCKKKLVQGYGMTEVSAAACYSKESVNKLGSVGIPYIKNSISVFEPDSTNELLIGETGEICIQTPTMMKGYYNNDQDTNNVKRLHNDGKLWVHTGDLGTIDYDGNIYIIGRMKRMIVRHGDKIFPQNIENIILLNKYVDNCAIVSMENEKDRHVPVAYIVLNDNVDNLEQLIHDLEKNICEQMPEFNVPYMYILKDELPLTNINKIDFKTLEKESEQYINENKKIIDNREILIKVKKM